MSFASIEAASYISRSWSSSMTFLSASPTSALKLTFLFAAIRRDFLYISAGSRTDVVRSASAIVCLQELIAMYDSTLRHQSTRLSGVEGDNEGWDGEGDGDAVDQVEPEDRTERAGIDEADDGDGAHLGDEAGIS